MERKRKRSTKKDIENRLLDAALTLIQESGFSNLTLKALTQKAGIEPPVFYNRYKDLNDFLKKLNVEEFDFWLNESVPFNPKNSVLHNIKRMLEALIDQFSNSLYMQKLIAWEMNDCNYVTKRTANGRDIKSEHLTRYYEEKLKDCDVSFSYSMAIIIGGIYYLILHRKVAAMNFVDFNKPENIEALKKCINLMVDRIFSDYKEEEYPQDRKLKQTLKVAEKLIENNVEYSIIKSSTGLSDDILNSLIISFQDN